MKFILNENVSPLIEKPLGDLGHTIIRLPSGTKDSDVFKFAQKEKAVIITHDKDFMAFPAWESEGIILVRIHPPWAKDVIASLSSFLTKISLSDWRGKLVLLERGGFHIRF